MSRKISLLAGLLMGIGSFAQGQWKDYRYQREIAGISGQWNRLVLPDNLFKKAADDLSDVRIYGITAGKDTIEAPYLVRETSDEVSTKEIAFRQLNSSYTDKGHFFTFEVPSTNPVNEIGLDFKQRNFDWRVKLEGSQDQREWFTMLNDYRIVSVKNALTDFKFTTLSFPKSVYRYFRLSVPGKDDPGLLAAHLSMQETKEGTYRSFAARMSVFPKDKRTKQTEIVLGLASPARVSFLKVNVKDQLDYFRPVDVSYLSDSVKTEKGWVYNYEPLSNGALYSQGTNTFSFPSRLLQTIKVTIDDQDNQPLTIANVEVKGYVQELIARFSQPATYYLVYGNKGIESPQYDIAQFSEKIPVSMPLLTLGDEQKLATAEAPAVTPLFNNKAWLWAIIVVMVLLLGVFSIRMMRKV